MPEIPTPANPSAKVGFIPHSAIGTNLTDVRKRRHEHDPTPLDLQFCWYLTPEAANQIKPEVLVALSADRQPIYGVLLSVDREKFDRYRDVLPESIQHQIPANYQLPTDLCGAMLFLLVRCHL